MISHDFCRRRRDRVVKYRLNSLLCYVCVGGEGGYGANGGSTFMVDVVGGEGKCYCTLCVRIQRVRHITQVNIEDRLM